MRREEHLTAIEKALRRARGEGSRSDGGPVPLPGNDVARAAARPPTPHDRIVYDRTRVAETPASELAAHRLIAGGLRSEQADIYRMLRAQVLNGLSACGGTSVAICSSRGGEGKTLTAANLAISTAMDPNHTVLLADLDLRRPRVQEYFGLGTVEAGLCDYLEGTVELPEAMVNPGIDGLVLLPVRRGMLNSSELLSSARMFHLIAELKSRYHDRVVIFDLPPLLSSDDSMVVLPHIDTSLLVVREGSARAGEIARSLKLLENHNLIGTVLNDSSEENVHPYY